MPKLLGLRCRECGAEYELQATHVCEMCFGPLDAVYDQAALKKIVSRSRIEQGPSSMWRYRDLLPVEDSVAVVTLGEGFTPLVKAERLGAETLGFDERCETLAQRHHRDRVLDRQQVAIPPHGAGPLLDA